MVFGVLTPSLASGSTSLITNGECDDEPKWTVVTAMMMTMTTMMMMMKMTMTTMTMIMMMFVRAQVLRPHPHLQLHKKQACPEPDDAPTT